MSLADELLADLEDGGEDIADEIQELDQTKLEDIAEEVEDVYMHVDPDKLNSIHNIAKLRDSKQVCIFYSSSVFCYGYHLQWKMLTKTEQYRTASREHLRAVKVVQ